MRRRIVLAGGAALLILGLAGATYLELRAPPGDQGMSERIAAAARRGPGTIIDFAELAPFYWTDVYFFQPYTNEERAERRMGIPWRYGWGAIEYQDHQVFVVFLDSGRVVAAFDQFHARGNLFLVSRQSDHLTRSQARFRVGDAPDFELEVLK